MTKPTPKADPAAANPNPWQIHTNALPIFRISRPIEVEFENGERKILRDPRLHEDVAKQIVFWRWHEAPEKMPYYVSFPWHRTFTFWDRVRILFGKNILVSIGVACRHHPGAAQPVVIGYVTKHSNLDDVMTDQRRRALERYLKPGAEKVKV